METGKLKKITSALFLLFISFSSSANNKPESTVQRQLDTLFQEHLTRIAAPGFAVAVVENDSVLFAKGYGVESINQPTPFSIDTIVGIGSLTKSFTAMLILQLRDEGLLNLDDPIIKYLPWFRAADKALSDKITIRMFLNMTSGLEQNLFRLLRYQSTDIDALETGVRNISSYQMLNEPGESFQYINEGWNTLGLIIEQLTGKSWEQALTDRILDPLSMNNTSASREWLLANPISYGHYSGTKPRPANFTHIQNSLPSGSGLYSNARDLTQYLIELLSSSQTKRTGLLTEKSREELWHPAISMPILPYELGGSSEKGAYAMGWMRMNIDGLDLVFHGGEFRVSSSLMLINPAQRTGVVILYNTGDLEPYSNESKIYVANNALRLLASLPISNFGKPRQADPSLNNYIPASSLESYIGTYVSSSGRRIEVSRGGSEGLLIKYADGIYPESFDVDFINRTNFNARSIAHNHSGYFQISDTGAVQSINMLGESFTRKRTVISGMSSYQLDSIGLGFQLPDVWRVDSDGASFVATRNDGSGASFTGKKAVTTYSQWYAQVKSMAVANSEIIESSDFINGRYIRFLIYKVAESDQAIAVYYTNDGDSYVLNLVSKESDVTLMTIETINVFLHSLVILDE